MCSSDLAQKLEDSQSKVKEQLEKIGLFLILSSIIVVAAFNIISSLIMLVLEKSREIAILKAIGAKDSGIRRIFFFQGLVIGSLGTIGGVLVG